MLAEKWMDYKEKQWQKRKCLLEREKALNKEKAAYREAKKSMSTTKKLMIFLMATCTAIIVFTGILMGSQIYLAYVKEYIPDFNPQTTLIGAIVGEVISFAIYSAKSLKENSKGGIVYDTAMIEMENDETLRKG